MFLKKIIRNFIQLEAASSLLLFIAVAFALLWANSPWQKNYDMIFFQHHTFFTLPISLLEIINNGLMTIFFFLVSLEIKRELIDGELNSKAKAILPAIAAAGGMLFPALIYLAITFKHPELLSGIAIPTATDIAFSLGILLLLGNRIPLSLKVFLTALAILDDLGAILIIAFFYTAQIHFLFLLGAAACIIVLILFNYFRLNKFWPYGIMGLLLWFFIIKSGIHATIAGVILGLTIPLQPQKNISLLKETENKLHIWVAFLILPLFALANAGFSFHEIDYKNILNPLTLGIILALFLGKQLGVFGSSFLAVKMRIAQLPKNINWLQLYGLALLCGVGFTMSLFIGALAFPDASIAQMSLIRFGVIAGSVLSGVAGYIVLRNNGIKHETA